MAPRFFIVKATGPGVVGLDVPSRVLQRGSRDPRSEGRACSAILSSEARSWKDVFPVNFLELIVSDRVAGNMRDAELRGIALFDVRFTQVQSRSLASGPIPKYFWPQIHGGIELDESLLWKDGARRSDFESAYRAVPLPGTWGGEDLFLSVAGVPFGKILCTRRFLKLAHTCKWNGLRFFPMDLPEPYRISASNAVDYLKRQWPLKWYPDGVEGHPNNLEEIDEP